AKAVRRIVREAAEHYEDLRHSAIAQGTNPADAMKQAEAQLGDPLTLAEQHCAVLRNTFKWGRWPLFSLAALPFTFPIGCPFLTFLVAFLGFELAWRTPGRVKWVWLACVASTLEILFVPTTLLNVATLWLVAGVVQLGYWQRAQSLTTTRELQHA
ncbi:MAG: hypothetical protein ACRETL_11040, partial [Gammaproteobacteria bacterium]